MRLRFWEAAEPEIEPLDFGPQPDRLDEDEDEMNTELHDYLIDIATLGLTDAQKVLYEKRARAEQERQEARKVLELKLVRVSAVAAVVGALGATAVVVVAIAALD